MLQNEDEKIIDADNNKIQQIFNTPPKPPSQFLQIAPPIILPPHTLSHSPVHNYCMRWKSSTLAPCTSNYSQHLTSQHSTFQKNVYLITTVINTFVISTHPIPRLVSAMILRPEANCGELVDKIAQNGHFYYQLAMSLALLPRSMLLRSTKSHLHGGIVAP